VICHPLAVVIKFRIFEKFNQSFKNSRKIYCYVTKLFKLKFRCV